MANSKTWYSWVDALLSDMTSAATMLKSVLWGLKAALKGEITGGTLGPAGSIPSGARWTVYYSCDGTTAGTANDGVDRWGGGTYDGTKIVRASSGAHSWMVLKSPTALATGGPYYLIIDYLSAADHQCIFVLSKAAPTGGTTSARPTSTDETALAATQFGDNGSWNTFTGRCHFTTDANGSFWFLTSRSSSSKLNAVIGVNVLTNLRQSADAWPVVLMVEGASATTNIMLEGGTILRSSSTQRTRAYNPIGPTTTAAVCGVAVLDVAGASGFGADMAGSFFADGKYDTFPCPVYVSTAALKGFKGELPDCLQMSATPGSGSRYPATGNIDKTLCGGVLLPLTAVPSM
jgi:hypothetical protein